MESRGHLRIVRKRNGDRNDPNHYRPIVKSGGGSQWLPGGRSPQTTRVVVPRLPNFLLNLLMLSLVATAPQVGRKKRKGTTEKGFSEPSALPRTTLNGLANGTASISDWPMDLIWTSIFCPRFRSCPVLPGSAGNQLAASIISTKRLRKRTPKGLRRRQLLLPGNLMEKATYSTTSITVYDNQPATREQALACLKILCGCYRASEVADPTTFNEAALRIMCNYPLDILRAVTNPAAGLPAKLKWFPSLAELKEACEMLMEPRRQYEDKLRRRAEQLDARDEWRHDQHRARRRLKYWQCLKKSALSSEAERSASSLAAMNSCSDMELPNETSMRCHRFS
jgi:hypothetical protein